MISYGGPELLLLFVVFIVTPILYRAFLRKLDRRKRIIIVSSLWILAFLIGYTDVIYIMLKARKLCREEAGLHVYRTVEAEGFLGDTDISYWSKHGFKYVEKEFIGGEKIRSTLANNEVKEEKVNTILSRYEYVRNLEVLETPFNRSRELIKDRRTGEVLGEIIAFKVYPGWIDSRLLGILGFTWIPLRCDGDYLPQRGKRTIYVPELIKAVIKPK